jgi:hypothetical protein
MNTKRDMARLAAPHFGPSTCCTKHIVWRSKLRHGVTEFMGGRHKAGHDEVGWIDAGTANPIGVV